MPQPVSVAFRWSEETRASIKRRADQLDLSMSEYVRQAALGELDVEPADIRKELDQLWKEVKRLGEMAYG